MHHGIDRAHMDLSVRPQDDLFAHANGTWLATAQIPQDRARYGAFDMLRENAEAAVRELIALGVAAREGWHLLHILVRFLFNNLSNYVAGAVNIT